MGDELPPIDLGTDFVPQQVTVGGGHACALSTAGKIKCWGLNQDGQLGQGHANSLGIKPGQMSNRLKAIDLGPNFVATIVTAGSRHTCALSKSHEVKCWGLNDQGQLGVEHNRSLGIRPGDMGSTLTPIDLGKGFVPADISAGLFHTCALSKSHEVKCWGHNYSGQLGQGTTEYLGDQANEMGDNLKPIDLGTNFISESISTGSYHSCALSRSRQIKCWGNNGDGQLGIGTKKDLGDNPNELGDHLKNVDLGPDFSTAGIQSGYGHTCAISESSILKCWGYNFYGQLGKGHQRNLGDEPEEMGNRLTPIEL
jgi:alpha-tubulin suppressor-like RCC1 family protein